MGQKFSSRVRQNEDEAVYYEEEAETYLGEKFTKEKPLSKAGTPRSPKAAKPAPVKIKNVNHAAIEASDVDAVAEFYISVLGFTKLPRPGLGFKGQWLEMPGMMLHIIEVDPSVPRRISNWKDLYEKEPEAWFIRRASHLAFEVEDFEATEASLRKHAVEYSRHVLPEVNMKQLFLYDPEGHGIELGVYDDSREFISKHGARPPSY